MSRGDLPAVSVWGRPFKPMAVAVIVASLLLAVNQVLAIFGMPVLLTPDGSLGTIGLLAGITVVSMVWSWVITSQFLFRVSMLFGVGAWTGRALETALDGRFWQAWLPFCFAGMIAGAYFVESADETSTHSVQVSGR